MIFSGNQHPLPEPGRKSDIWMFGVFVLELFAFPKWPSYFQDFRNNGMWFMRQLANRNFDMKEKSMEYLKEAFVGRGVDDRQSKFKAILENCLEFEEVTRADSQKLLELCQLLIRT